MVLDGLENNVVEGRLPGQPSPSIREQRQRDAISHFTHQQTEAKKAVRKSSKELVLLRKAILERTEHGSQGLKWSKGRLWFFLLRT